MRSALPRDYKKKAVKLTICTNTQKITKQKVVFVPQPLKGREGLESSMYHPKLFWRRLLVYFKLCISFLCVLERGGKRCWVPESFGTRGSSLTQSHSRTMCRECKEVSSLTQSYSRIKSIESRTMLIHWHLVTAHTTCKEYSSLTTKSLQKYMMTAESAKRLAY